MYSFLTNILARHTLKSIGKRMSDRQKENVETAGSCCLPVDELRWRKPHPCYFDIPLEDLYLYLHWKYFMMPLA